MLDPQIPPAARATASANGPVCPMLNVAGFLLRTLPLVEAMDDDTADRVFAESVGPAWGTFYVRTPETRSMAGAVAALQLLAQADDCDEVDASVLRSVLRFLKQQPGTQLADPPA